jgi:AcrR family transcriptional regulator
MGLREQNKQAKLQRLRDAAGELFSSKGYAKTTLKEIAVRAQIGSGTLYLYAQSKEDLLALSIGPSYEQAIVELARSAPLASGLAAQANHVLCGMLEYHARDLETSWYFLREFMFPERSRHSPETHVDAAQPLIDALTRQANTWQRRGHLRAHQRANEVADCLFALYLLALSRLLVARQHKDAAMASLRASVQTMLDSFHPR